MKLKLLETFPVKPMSPTKATAIKNLMSKMEEFFQEIEKINYFNAPYIIQKSDLIFKKLK